ncbi:MAG: hypothetical protein C4575_12485 [Desulforudis sp.]|nr:MAG: hypothetical protein C4575_12485 [Desulforudis sp.]
MRTEDGYSAFFPEDIREDVLFFGLINPKHMYIIGPALIAGVVFFLLPLQVGLRLVLFLGVPAAGIVIATADLPRNMRRLKKYRLEKPTLVAGEDLEEAIIPLKGIEEPYVLFQDGSAAIVLRIEPPPWESQMMNGRIHANETLRSALRTAADKGTEVTVYMDVEPDIHVNEWKRQAERLRDHPAGLRQLGEARLVHHMNLAARHIAKRVVYHTRLQTRRTHIRPGRRHHRKTNPLIASLEEITSSVVGELERAGHRITALSTQAVEDLEHRQLNPLDWESEVFEDIKGMGMGQLAEPADPGHGRYWWVGSKIVIIGSPDPGLSSRTSALLAKALANRGLPTVLVDGDRRGRGAAALQRKPTATRRSQLISWLEEQWTNHRAITRKVVIRRAKDRLVDHVNEAARQGRGRQGWVVVNLSPDRQGDELAESMLLEAASEVWMALHESGEQPVFSLGGKGRFVIWPAGDIDSNALPQSDLQTAVVRSSTLPEDTIDDLIYAEVDYE